MSYKKELPMIKNDLLLDEKYFNFGWLLYSESFQKIWTKSNELEEFYLFFNSNIHLNNFFFDYSTYEFYSNMKDVKTIGKNRNKFKDYRFIWQFITSTNNISKNLDNYINVLEKYNIIFNTDNIRNEILINLVSPQTFNLPFYISPLGLYKDMNIQNNIFYTTKRDSMIGSFIKGDYYWLEFLIFSNKFLEQYNKLSSMKRRTLRISIRNMFTVEYTKIKFNLKEYNNQYDLKQVWNRQLFIITPWAFKIRKSILQYKLQQE